MNVQCTSRMSEDARAVTTVLSQRNGCLRTGHGHSTFAFSSQTGNQSHLPWITLRISLCSEVCSLSAFSPKRKNLSSRPGMGAGQWCRSAPWTEAHSPRPAHPNATDSVTLPREEHSRVEVLPLKPEQEQPNTFNRISLQTSTSKDFSIRL